MTSLARAPAVFPDLSATVDARSADPALIAELPGLYGSLFATHAWFEAEDQKRPSGTCVLEHPRHVLAFTVEGETVEILNKAFRITPGDAERGCRAIFRAVPEARRIHLEVLFPPSGLRLPKRVLREADDLVIALPPSPDDYTASLGKRTRKNLRNFDNRLRRDHPDVTTRVVFPTSSGLRELADLFVSWNIERFHAGGKQSSYEREPHRRGKLLRLLELSAAVAQITSIQGRPAAIEFIIYVGDEATIYAGAFDPAFSDLHLGFLSTYWAVREVVRHGSHTCHLLWTTAEYKRHLGAVPQTATRLSVFPGQLDRVWSLREAAEVHRRTLRDSGTRLYWDARHAARRVAERAGVRRPSSEGDAS